MRRFDPRTRVLGAPVDGDGDGDEITGAKLLVERLPDRQVETTSSPRGPDDEEDLPAAMIRQSVRAAVEVCELEVRCGERLQRSRALVRADAEPRDSFGDVERERSAEDAGERGEIDVAVGAESGRRRHARSVAAETVFGDLPAERGVEGIGVETDAAVVARDVERGGTAVVDEREAIRAQSVATVRAAACPVNAGGRARRPFSARASTPASGVSAA